MNALKTSVELFFIALSVLVVRRAWWVLLLISLSTAALLPQMGKIWMDLSTESYLPTNDPAVTDFHRFRMEFGFSGPGIVAVKVNGSVFEPENLARLKALQADIEANVDFVDDMISLVSADYTAVDGDDLTVEPLEAIWPSAKDTLEQDMAWF